MAHKESDILALNEKYKLDKYEFSIKTQQIPMTGLMDVIVSATGPNEKMGAKTIQMQKTDEIDGWYVEATSNTADTYLVTREREGGEGRTSGLETSIPQPIIPSTTYTLRGAGDDHVITINRGIFLVDESAIGRGGCYPVICSTTGEDIEVTHLLVSSGEISKTTKHLSTGESIDGKIAYTADGLHFPSYWTLVSADGGVYTQNADYNSCWTALYGTPTGDYGDQKSVLIGRFAIDIRIAGGTAGNGGAEPGPDGQPWQDVDDGQPTLWPGDEGYPDPEDPDYPGDDMPYYPPAKTLHVTINGALSGRHNDPLNDTSYSYLPSDQIAQPQYGSGGIGGNGGGGGAGASTIIVRKFATKKADSKTYVLKPKRHGYGSGGGKGGKGGDGCILIYY